MATWDRVRWTREIQRIAQTGLTYTKDPYDKERFQDLLAVAQEMANAVAARSDGEPIVTADEIGYPTPKLDVRAVVPQGGSLLFVRDRGLGLWTLPGGWVDLGQSLAEAAIKEVREESGYAVRPTKLLALYDRDRHPHPPILWRSHKAFIRCEIEGGSPTESVETDGVAFFTRDALPQLSLTHVTPDEITAMFEHLDDPDLPTTFE